jgi:hypothetical protein
MRGNEQWRIALTMRSWSPEWLSKDWDQPIHLWRKVAMMKVADLQQLVTGLTQPMRSAGASQKVLDDLARLAQGLEPFKENTMQEFNDFLQKAEQCVRTGEWPRPGQRSSRRSGESRGPRMSVDEAAQRLASLTERAAADSNMDYAAIETEVMTMEPLSVPQLKEAAEQVHIQARGRTKQDMLKAIAVAVKEGKSAQRAMGERRPERPGQPQPVGAFNQGNA